MYNFSCKAEGKSPNRTHNREGLKMAKVSNKRHSLSQEAKRLRIEELQARIADAVESFVDERNWQEWLEFVATFHKYSWRNQVLIMSQYPNAVQVAGFNTWKAHGRIVRKGEKGIRIFGGRETEIVDEETGEIIGRKTHFFPVSVFDICQTDLIDGAKEVLPPTLTLEGEDEAGIFEPLAAYVKSLGYKIEREKMTLKKGYTIAEKKKVALDSASSNALAAKTLLHETAHILLHAELSHGEYELHRGIWETEAESVAYVVASYFGFDTASYSIPYIKGWSSSDRKLIESTACNVSKAARTIIDKITEFTQAEN